ncbi:MAG TPA: hypothetical protein DCM86_02030, partial [Verrucomicrobiales bacterium]|nr:hypothetical protein [Verrucomicrobiales bacterium]
MTRRHRALWLLLWWATAPHLPAGTTRTWVNPAGGSWFVPANWSPSGTPAPGDSLFITNNGTYTVTILTNAATVGNVTLGGTSGTQTLVNGTTSALVVTNLAEVRKNGLLVITNSGFSGNLVIRAGGETKLGGGGNLQLYSSAITNLGTLTWSSGSLSVGGNNNATTVISNGGLWQITGDTVINYGGGSRPLLVNGGTLRKTAGAGATSFNGMDLVNLPSGIVDAQTGTLRLSAFQTNVLGGTLSAAVGAGISFVAGTITDAGGVTAGGGTFLFSGGNYYLRTNLIPGIKLTGGDLYLNGSTFQQAGTITNLTLDGSQLHGSNKVSGTLVLNSGGVLDRVTVLPSGEFLLSTPTFKLLYGLAIINQGAVRWSGGGLAVG